MKLNEKGQCPECLIKPLVYKRSHGHNHPAQKFCHRCFRSYNLNTDEQQGNWAWVRCTDGEFKRRVNGEGEDR